MNVCQVAKLSKVLFHLTNFIINQNFPRFEHVFKLNSTSRSVVPSNIKAWFVELSQQWNEPKLKQNFNLCRRQPSALEKLPGQKFHSNFFPNLYLPAQQRYCAIRVCVWVRWEISQDFRPSTSLNLPKRRQRRCRGGDKLFNEHQFVDTSLISSSILPHFAESWSGIVLSLNRKCPCFMGASWEETFEDFSSKIDSRSRGNSGTM